MAKSYLLAATCFSLSCNWFSAGRDRYKFGRTRLVEGAEAYQKAKKLGPDALLITAAELHRKLSRRRVFVKPLLLDQSLTAGLGNWIVDEVLFQAKIHPRWLGNSIFEEESVALHAAIQLVLTTAIQHEANYRNFFESFLFHAREWDDSATPVLAVGNGDAP